MGPLIPVLAGVSALALIFRAKLKEAAHAANNDAQAVAANVHNAATNVLTTKPSKEQIAATIAQAIAAGGKQVGGVILSASDQAAIAAGIPPAFVAILNGPGEPASQATINTLKIAVASGQAPNPATTLKTTIGGSLFDTAAMPPSLLGMPDTTMVQAAPGDLLAVDMNLAGIPGGPGTTAFVVRAKSDLASNTVNAENIDPRVPAGLVMDVPFAAIGGIGTV